jgi:hypothetical protein
MRTVFFPEGLSPIQKAMYLQETGRAHSFYSHVYLGILNWMGGRVFLKVGKANDPKKRAMSYCTHIPHGLTRMLAAVAKSQAHALDAEDRLYEKLLEIPAAEPESGEWISIAAENLSLAEQIFAGIGGEVFEVQWPVPAIRKKKRAVDLQKSDEIEALYRFEAQQAEVVIKQKRRLTTSVYAGTPRG